MRVLPMRFLETNVSFYLPMGNGNLAVAHRQGCCCATYTLPLPDGK